MIRGLPYDHEVEYLQSDGAQYIYTGLDWDSGHWVCDAELTFTEVVYENFAIASRYSFLKDGSFAFYTFAYVQNYNVRIGYQTNTAAQAGIPASFIGEKHVWHSDYRDGSQTLNVSGITLTGTRNWVQPDKDNATNIMLGGSFDYGSHGQGVRYGRIKIWHNDVLVWDSIPVCVGSVGYMYDRVSGRLFGNQGTGSYTLGPDVATPVLGLRRFANRAALPIGGRRLAYLESTGTQWIDTGVLADSDTGICGHVKAGTTVPTGSSYPSVADAHSNGYGEYISLSWHDDNSSKNFTDVYYNGQNPFLHTLLEEFTASVNFLNDGKIRLQNQEVAIPSMPSIPVNYHIFGAGGPNGVEDLSCTRIYWLRISKGSQVVRDFIPIAIGDVGYLYDTVHGALYPNQGTGAFVLEEVS